MASQNNAKSKITLAYAGILFVVLIWGLYPILTSDLLQHYSGGMYTLGSSLVSAAALFLLCLPKLKNVDKSYFKVAIPTGFFMGLANLLQKIGLQYTTPTQYAFLENLSCVVVPILLFLFVRKKPSAVTVTASVLCLVGCFILSGMDVSAGSLAFGKGEILCALAGVMYGVNIAATGVYAKKMDAMVYVMIQQWVNAAVAAVAVFALDKIKINGSPIERAVFSFDILHVLSMAGLVLCISTLGWIIRTEAMKYVSATAVAIVMPFSSVVTGVIAVLIGADTFSLPLLFGGLIILVSSILSSLDDILDKKEKTKRRDVHDESNRNG